MSLKTITLLSTCAIVIGAALLAYRFGICVGAGIGLVALGVMPVTVDPEAED